MQPIIQILERLGEIEWYAIRPVASSSEAVAPLYAPIVTFRYKGGNICHLPRLRECIAKYEGDMPWIIVGEGNKNICIMSQIIHDATLKTGCGTAIVIDTLLKSDPTLVKRIQNDFDNFVSYLQAAL